MKDFFLRGLNVTKWIAIVIFGIHTLIVVIREPMTLVWATAFIAILLVLGLAGAALLRWADR